MLDQGIEDISNMLARTKVVQHWSNFQPYMTEELKDLGESVKLKFSQAVTTGRDFNWDDHNNTNSIYQKALSLAKKSIFCLNLNWSQAYMELYKNYKWRVQNIHPNM